MQQKTNSTSRNNKLILTLLIIILVFALAIRLGSIFGYERLDSLKYSQAAYAMLHGDFFKEQWFGMTRLPLIAPLAASYGLFGVSEFSSIIWVLLCNMAGIVVLYFIGKKIANPTIGLVAAFVAALFPLELNAATILLPDGMSLLFIGLPILLYLTAQDKQGKQRAWLFIAAGTVWGLSYFTKINYVVIYPIFFIVHSVAYKKFRVRDVLYSLIGFAFIWLTFGAYFYSGYGKFDLQEYQHLMIQEHGLENVSMRNMPILDYHNLAGIPDSQSATTIVDNLHKAYTIIFTKRTISTTAFIFLAAIVLLIASPRRKKYKPIFVLLTSLLVYSIIAYTLNWYKIERYYTVITLFVCLTIAAAISDIFQYSQKQWYRTLVIVLTSGLAVTYSAIALPLVMETVRHHNTQTGNDAGYFYEIRTMLNETKDDIDWQSATILVPMGRWQRTLNLYLGYNTGYNNFDLESYKNSRLLNYIQAGAQFTKGARYDLYLTSAKFDVIVDDGRLKIPDDIRNQYKPVYRYENSDYAFTVYSLQGESNEKTD